MVIRATGSEAGAVTMDCGTVAVTMDCGTVVVVCDEQHGIDGWDMVQIFEPGRVARLA
jgi:hypothetical protein